LDVLSTANLLNYFGRMLDFNEIQLKPILMEKGHTRLALYGLGHIRDERLHRVFGEHKVAFLRPAEEKDDWFSICCVHQNRLTRGATTGPAKGYLKESFLPDFLDLVVWGHEHTCLLQGGMASLAQTPGRKFTVLQPGSTVATSLSTAEALPKHVAMLHVHREQWKMEAIKLERVRPFMHRDVVLRALPSPPRTEEQLMAFLTAEVEKLLALADEEQPANVLDAGSERLRVPLVRIRVDYSGESVTCNPQRFGARFVGRVANPNEILLFFRKASKKTGKPAVGAIDDGADDDEEEGGPGALRNMTDSSLQQETHAIEDLVTDLLKEQGETMRVLGVPELNEAVHEYVHKDTAQAIRTFVDQAMRATKTRLEADPELTSKLDAKDAREHARVVNEHLRGGAVDDDDEAAPQPAAPPAPPARKAAAAPKRRRAASADDDDDDDDDDAQDDDDDDEPPPTAAGRGRGRGRGATPAASRAGARGARGAAGGAASKSRAKPAAKSGKAAKAAQAELEDSDDEPAARGGGGDEEEDDDDGFAMVQSARTAAKPAASRSTRAPARSSAAPSSRQTAAAPIIDDLDDDDDEDAYTAGQQAQQARGGAQWGARRR
jgi:double-strand break repair protein MRE11